MDSKGLSVAERVKFFENMTKSVREEGDRVREPKVKTANKTGTRTLRIGVLHPTEVRLPRQIVSERVLYTIRGKEAAGLLTECSKQGQALSSGSVFYRGDGRDEDAIRDAGGFVPRNVRDGVNPVDSARERVKSILAEWQAQDFMEAWKWSSARGDLLKEDLKRHDVYDQHMEGTATSTNTGGEKGGHTYKVTLGENIHVIASMTQGTMYGIYFYGNGMDVDASTVLGMHLVKGNEGTEFVFMTPVPMDWIEEVR